MDNFQQRKNSILSKLDKSSKKSWDKKIVSLCEKINSLESFYTTSSCSGRVVLIINNDKKISGLFVKVWHEKIFVEDLKKELGKIKKGNTKFKKKDSKSFIGLNLEIKFKQEPALLHVVCGSLEDAFGFLKKAREVGFKRGGLISGNEKQFVLELIGTEKLEFPIISEGKILVDDEFLEAVVKKANENLKKNWLRIKKLKNIL